MSEEPFAFSPDIPIYDEKGWRLLERIPSMGITRWMMMLEDGEMIIRTDTEVNALLDTNTAERNIKAGQRWGDGRKVASIPAQIWTRDLAEAVRQDDNRYLSRWLNDADHAAFRTFEGKV
mgnify:CR=1 FL=1